MTLNESYNQFNNSLIFIRTFQLQTPNLAEIINKTNAQKLENVAKDEELSIGNTLSKLSYSHNTIQQGNKQPSTHSFSINNNNTNSEQNRNHILKKNHKPHTNNKVEMSKSGISNSSNFHKSIYHRQFNKLSKSNTPASNVRKFSLQQSSSRKKSRFVAHQNSVDSSRNFSVQNQSFQRSLRPHYDKTVSKIKQNKLQKQKISNSQFDVYSQGDRKSIYLESFKCKIEDQIKNINKVLENIRDKSSTPRSSQKVVKVDLSASKGSLTPRLFQKEKVIRSRIEEAQMESQKIIGQSRVLEKYAVRSPGKRNLLQSRSKDSKTPSRIGFPNKKQLLTTRIAKYH